jgi:hypothetical protein
MKILGVALILATALIALLGMNPLRSKSSVVIKKHNEFGFYFAESRQNELDAGMLDQVIAERCPELRNVPLLQFIDHDGRQTVICRVEIEYTHNVISCLLANNCREKI